LICIVWQKRTLRRSSQARRWGFCYALAVHAEQFVYPALNAPLIEAYDQAYESAYILLHPFVRVPEALAWKATRQYPDDAQILSQGRKCRWAEAARGAGIRNCAQMSQALLTSIGAIDECLRDYESRDALQRYLQAEPVWMPTEGRFEPLLQADLLDAFESAGYEELVFVPEFPATDPPRRISVNALKNRETEFPTRGSLVAPDARFLFTVDWDSFFTLFYGPRLLVDEVVKARGLEGFYAEKETEHFWFNWKMGCATVTVAPEGWTAL
jgi:hypothetical protein